MFFVLVRERKCWLALCCSPAPSPPPPPRTHTCIHTLPTPMMLFVRHLKLKCLQKYPVTSCQSTNIPVNQYGHIGARRNNQYYYQCTVLAFKFLTYELCVAANMPEFAHYLSKEQQDELRSIAQAIVAPGKGILAADESVGQFPASALPLWLITQWDPPGTINIRRPPLF